MCWKREKFWTIIFNSAVVLFFLGMIGNTYATTVTVSGRQLVVNGDPFTIKGVG